MKYLKQFLPNEALLDTTIFLYFKVFFIEIGLICQ